MVPYFPIWDLLCTLAWVLCGKEVLRGVTALGRPSVPSQL